MRLAYTRRTKNSTLIAAHAAPSYGELSTRRHKCLIFVHNMVYHVPHDENIFVEGFRIYSVEHNPITRASSFRYLRMILCFKDVLQLKCARSLRGMNRVFHRIFYKKQLGVCLHLRLYVKCTIIFL